nr:cathepsin L1-like [Onthophagus taurus]
MNFYFVFLLFFYLTPTRSQFGFKPLNPISTLTNAATNAVKNLPLSPEDLITLNSEWTKHLNVASYANPAELAKRKDIFTKNFQLVTQHAKDFVSGKSSFDLKLTDLADLVLDEFNKFFNGYASRPKKSNTQKPDKIETATTDQLPENVDWRQKGAVTPVKSQEKCASCYAFSAAGALEGHNFIKSNTLKELSPQNIMDCAKANYSIWGCGGGYVDDSFSYVKDNGINILGDYPFEAKDGQCRFDSKTSAASAKGYALIPPGDEKALMEAVAKKGPVSVAINAGLNTMQLYSRGVYYDKDCKNGEDDVNHAVLVVGYGVENGEKYWLIKNSYGTNWGEDGYLKLAKDKGNHCGVATSAFYPIV